MRTNRVSTDSVPFRQIRWLLSTGAVSVALLLALMAMVESNRANGFDLPASGGLTAVDQKELDTLFAPAQVTIPQPWPFPVQLAVTPTLPAANNAITILASGLWRNTCVPRYETHQITDNQIRITAVADPPPAICGQAITPWSFSLAIGALPAGDYQIDLLITAYGDAARHPTLTFTVTPAPVAQLITATGGEMTQRDNGQRITLIVPPGALSEPNVFVISYQSTPTTTTPLQPLGHPFAISAMQTNFTKPFTLTIRYSDTVLGPVIPDAVNLYRLQSGQWVSDGITVTSRLTDGLTTQITHLSLYGLLSEVNRFYLPILR